MYCFAKVHTKKLIAHNAHNQGRSQEFAKGGNRKYGDGSLTAGPSGFQGKAPAVWGLGQTPQEKKLSHVLIGSPLLTTKVLASFRPQTWKFWTSSATVNPSTSVATYWHSLINSTEFVPWITERFTANVTTWSLYHFMFQSTAWTSFLARPQSIVITSQQSQFKQLNSTASLRNNWLNTCLRNSKH